MSKRRATNEEAMGGRETQRACEHRGAACEQRGAACEQRGAHADDPTHPTAHAGCERSSRAACDRRGVSVGMLVGSGRVESYVLDVASMHASALAFSSLARCEYTLLASRRSASRPHVRVHGPPRATTTRPTETHPAQATKVSLTPVYGIAPVLWGCLLFCGWPSLPYVLRCAPV